MGDITTGTYWSKLVSPVVYSGTTLDLKTTKEPINVWCLDSPGKPELAYPCHEMTALEMHSIVVSSKYSNWQ